MKILFEQKKPGRTRQTIVPVEMEIAGKPANVGELIEAAVRRVVADFNDRASRAEAVANALQGYDDGLFRIFLNGRLLGKKIRHGDELQDSSSSSSAIMK